MSYYFLKTVLKKLFAAAAALAASAPAAFAGPYLNWETNLSYTVLITPLLFMSSTLVGKVRTVLPPTTSRAALLIPQDAASSSDLEPPVAGGAVAVSESVSVYGELSLVTAKENGYGAMRNQVFLLITHRNQ